MFRQLSRSRSLVRTGFFRSDPSPPAKPYYFIDPEDPLFSVADEYRYTDDPTMQSPVLERSNVGMGMLLANSKVSNLGFVNMMYRKLRDLEVNTLKRFTAVTMSDKKAIVGPMGLRHLLLLNEACKSDNCELAKYQFLESLRNQADLALVVSDYFKPLITLLNGQDSGVGIATLANNAGCYKDSQIAFNLNQYGMVPTGGLSFALAKTPWHIGEFFALTSRKVTGQNILLSGLAKRWISPEAFPFMEVTSEHKLEVSEKDANALLSEHFLTPPTEWSLKPFVNLINEAFGQEHFEDIVRSLRRVGASQSSDPKQAAFAKECLDRMTMADPLALRLTHALIRRARGHIQSVTQRAIDEEGEETVSFMERRHPNLFQSQISRPAMIESLKDELRVAYRLLGTDQLGMRLHAYIIGQGRKDDDWDRVTFSTSKLAEYFEPLPAGMDYRYSERSDFPLSAHPKLRKFHPDYNPKTGMDHDPQFMANQVVRWSDDYMQAEIEELRCGVSGLSKSEIRNNVTIRWDS